MKNIFKGRFFSFFKKKSVIIVAIVLLLGVAVFVNYRWFYDPVNDVGYGDSGKVNADADTGKDDQTVSDYFTAADLSRQQARDEALEVLQAAVSTSSDDKEKLQTTLAQISRIAEDIENESNIETLLLAKGFTKCVAVINGDSASIIVSSDSEGLLPTQVAQISAVVYEQTGILPANVTIIQK